MAISLAQAEELSSKTAQTVPGSGEGLTKPSDGKTAVNDPIELHLALWN